MSKKNTLRLSPVTPCCDACVTGALKHAGFDYTDPFVVFSNIKDLPKSRRRELVDQIISTAEGNVILIVSAPIPAECREEESPSTSASTTPEEEGAAPTPEELERLLGLDDEGAH